MEPGCHLADDSLGVAWAKTLYPEAPALVKTFVIYHHLFFSNRQNVLILWDSRSENVKESLKLTYCVNQASAGLGN